MAWYLWLLLAFCVMFALALLIAYYFMYIKKDEFSMMVREQSEAMADDMMDGGED